MTKKNTFVVKSIVAMFRELNFVISERKKVFKTKNPSLELKLCRETLDNYVTYRLPESANKDFFVAVRVYLRLVRALFSSEKGSLEINKTANSAILGPAASKKEAILDNLKFQGEKSPRFYFVKENLRPKLNLVQKIAVLFRLTLYAKWTYLKTFNGKLRQRKALSILQVFETASLLHLTKQHNIDRVYDFTGFHIDSNFIAYLLSSRNITVVKAPSPGPIKTHYQHLITGTICYSSPYHKAELEAYTDTMIYTEAIKWKPQMSHLYLPYYLEKKLEPNTEKTLAFYSHGEWLRREMDHSDVGTGTLASEEFILECLKNFLSDNPDYSLTVYPHPLEKREENWSKTEKYYESKLEDINYTLIEKKLKTSLSFHEENIAVVAASTMIYERLLCGFKILIGSKSSNFLESSSLKNIEFSNYDEFEKLITSSIDLDSKRFFEERDLLEYHHSTYS